LFCVSSAVGGSTRGAALFAKRQFQHRELFLAIHHSVELLHLDRAPGHHQGQIVIPGRHVPRDLAIARLEGLVVLRGCRLSDKLFLG
jgi:hypothetical protein